MRWKSTGARTALLLAVLALVPTSLAAAAAVPPAGPGSDLGDAQLFAMWRQRSDVKVTAAYREHLQGAALNDVEDALVQYRGSVTVADRARLAALGAEIVRSYQAVPGLHIRAPVESLLALSSDARVFHLEANENLAGDQEVSTSVVNASLLWETAVKGAQNLPFGVDGRGVTIAVVDTGVDAGHPDLDFGFKTVANMVETAPGLWVSIENADTSVGHGTHVAGTVAGNGDASAGARRGVAPGANLVGVTIANPTVVDYMSALDWVYRNSRPGNNQYNIRGATNSWHNHDTHGEWDPEAALTQTIEALAFENNVVSTWSAGNHGREDPSGEQALTSGQGSTPVAIKCSAFAHDGTYIADFSSVSKRGLIQTYPDTGAPGVSIWSTAARRTGISSGSFIGGNTNPYYLAISGTSMSTPHVAGVVALILSVAPSLKVSDRHEDYNGTNTTEWLENPRTRIHEVEWILEVASTYVPSPAAQANGSTAEPGADGRPHDNIQGYGIVDAHKAVAIALALEKLRKDNPERDVTVDDALRALPSMRYFESPTNGTNMVSTSWQGEFGRFTDLGLNSLSTANQTKFVYVPPSATTLEMEIDFVAIDVERRSIGDLTYAIDWDRDGTNEVTGPSTPTPPGGHKSGSVPVPREYAGTVVAVNVLGNGIRMQSLLRDHNYVEWRSHYSMGVRAVLEMPEGNAITIVDKGNYSAMLAPWQAVTPAEDYAGGEVAVNTSYIDVRGVSLAPLAPPPRGVTVLPFGGAFLLLLVAAAVVAAAATRIPAVRTRIERLPGGDLVIRAGTLALSLPNRAMGAARHLRSVLPGR